VSESRTERREQHQPRPFPPLGGQILRLSGSRVYTTPVARKLDCEGDDGRMREIDAGEDDGMNTARLGSAALGKIPQLWGYFLVLAEPGSESKRRSSPFSRDQHHQGMRVVELIVVISTAGL